MEGRTRNRILEGTLACLPSNACTRRNLIADIQGGKSAGDWTSFKATRAKLAEHPIEEVGAKLRDMMPWIKKGALVDRTKN